MPHIWELTPEEFIGDFPVDDSDLENVDAGLGAEIEWLAEGWNDKTMNEIRPGVFIADVVDAPGDVALLFQERDGHLDLVGGYCQETLWVHRKFRGQGIATELVIAAAERRGGVMDPCSYTPGGLAAHQAAHRLAVHRALSTGENVPQRVRDSYPGLKKAPAQSRTRRRKTPHNRRDAE